MPAEPISNQARFAAMPPKAGGYESFYLKANHPSEPLGLWVRYTVHKRPGQAASGSLWCTLFDRGADGPRAVKATLPEPATDGETLLRIGDSTITEGTAVGHAEGEGREASWDLRFRSSEPPLHHLPRGWMYRAPVPRTKLLSPAPDATFDGGVSVDGRELTLTGWRGMVGHNWGAQHAERWIWMQGAGEGAWIDAAIGRIKLGPATTPWIANGAISIDGRRHALGGIERTRSTAIHERPDGCEFVLPGKDVTVRGRVGAPKKDFVGWVYADPDGSEHHTVNCSVSDMELELQGAGGEPRRLEVKAAAAYELGMRERDHGMPIQPFPDG